MNLRRWIIPCLAMMALIPALLAAQTTITLKPHSVEPAAWITHVEGRIFFQNFEKAEADMAVKPGDELNTQKGRIEIELGEGNWVRLDQNTRVVFTDIQKDSATLSLWEGSLYLHLKDQSVKVRSAQEEHLFQDKGLVRIDIDQNKTKISKDPRVADDFDGWSRSRDEELTSSQPEAGRYRSPWFYGGAFSPFWPWSPFDWYGGFYPYWSSWSPFLWSYYSWPSWYFGWNPFWYGNPWSYGYGSYFGGFYGGAYGRYGRNYRDDRVGRNGRPIDRVIGRDQIRRPEGLDGRTVRTLRPGSSTGNATASVYPSRTPTRAIRPSSNSSGARTSSGTIRSGSSRSSAPRSSAGSGGRSSSGSSGGRSSGGRSSGGGGRRR